MHSLKIFLNWLNPLFFKEPKIKIFPVELYKYFGWVITESKENKDTCTHQLCIDQREVTFFSTGTKFQ